MTPSAVAPPSVTDLAGSRVAGAAPRVASALALGAVLYVPADHGRAEAIARGHGPWAVRTVILCLEDALGEANLAIGLAAVARIVADPLPPGAPALFVRPRHPALLAELLEIPGIARLSGVVLPKVTAERWRHYQVVLEDGPGDWQVMPILETADAFDDRTLTGLVGAILEAGLGARLLAMRIGASDLLSRLGLRRGPEQSVYDTPLGGLIGHLVCRLRAAGIILTAPVFDDLDRPDLLAREVARDVSFGLYGKTAIHPAHVPVIEAGYAVTPEDLADAHAILDAGASAVFRSRGRMNETAVHRAWATTILDRAALFGVRPAAGEVAAAATAAEDLVGLGDRVVPFSPR